MAGPRQKRKQRSSRSTVKTGTAGRTKQGKKKVNFLSNEVIAKNWDHKLTLVQNYERLGLSVRLNDRTGGVEKKARPVSDKAEDSLKIQRSSTARANKLVPQEIAVETDPQTGAIIGIVGEENNSTNNPLNDPLNDLEEIDDRVLELDGASKQGQNTNEIVRLLEAQAAAESEEIAHRKKPRSQSEREEEWIRQLVDKYDEDYTAMFRDRKLNPRQQSEGDIKRRVKKWKAAHG